MFSASTAVAQTTPDDESMLLIQSLGLKDELPKPGYNMEGGSVFDSYVKARRDGQFSLFGEGIFQYETPSSALIDELTLHWCSNLHFLATNGAVGYTVRCVTAYLNDPAECDDVGAQSSRALAADEFTATFSLSASYSAQANMFNMADHSTTDNYVELYSDAGLPTMPYWLGNS